jgi:uncharacterized protein (TIGR03546 family)
MTSGTAKRTTNPLIDVLMQHRSPGAIAGGLAFGTMLGLMPKDSLLALCILSLIATLPINQLVACCATIGLTLIETMTWGLTDWIGFHTLSLGAVSSLIGAIYQFPIAPWLRLENTVVMGSFVLGLILWGPCFLLTYRLSSRFQKSIVVDEVTVLAAAALRYQSSNYTDTRSIDPEPLAVCQPAPHETSSDSPSTVSTESTELVIAASDSHPTEANLPDTAERILHETLIEVIRFKRPATHRPTSDLTTPTISSSENEPMHLTNFIRKDSAETTANKPALPGHFSSPSAAVNISQLHSQPHSKEDSLRNILKHIHTARESKREVERSS